MTIEKPIKVGISEKATNNPPIEILVQSEATLNSLPKTWPIGTVAYTPGRTSQWKFNASGGWDAVSEIAIEDLSDLAIANPAEGQTLAYDAAAEKWKNTSLTMLIAEEAGESDSTQLDAKWQDIFDAIVAGKAVILYDEEGLSAFPIKACYKDGSDYTVEIGSDTYVASAADGNPVKEAETT